MDKFGPFNMVQSLAGGDFTKWEEVLQFEIETAFTMILMKTEETALSLRIQRNRNKK